jgi:hypothetical protein
VIETLESCENILVEKDLKMILKRAELLAAARRVLDLSLDKIDNRYTKGSEKVAWARVVIQAITAADDVLNDADLEELKARIERLEGEKHE